ncbi:hypothetical protein PanWU01x14_031110 [Parasponia andersonii]|uniref:Transmembrane protein n=1 Tax=Parasponia andersonii TaxID=3476 RepID=A0A2P5DU29_PARAD|nr:hypothetical protein PanWU01x14_031110 [Parasponia andersonii]
METSLIPIQTLNAKHNLSTLIFFFHLLDFWVLVATDLAIWVLLGFFHFQPFSSKERLSSDSEKSLFSRY